MAEKPSRKKGSSRSSQYRRIDRDPELRALADAYRALFKNQRNFKQATLDNYCKQPIFTAPSYSIDPVTGERKVIEGYSPETVKQFALHNERAARARVQTGRRQKQTSAKRKKARAEIAKGRTRTSVAAELGMTTRGLRKLLKG